MWISRIGSRIYRYTDQIADLLCPILMGIDSRTLILFFFFFSEVALKCHNPRVTLSRSFFRSLRWISEPKAKRKNNKYRIL